MIRLLIVALLSTSFLAAHGQSQQSDLVTYQKDSVFIQEFPIPLTERGLRGITTDSEGNVWTIHSTNSSSLVLKFEPRTGRFMQYPIAGETISEL